ncbi:molybdopterin-dependent oxidoreductase [Streptomyces sp. HK10]|uniref:molybdopterin-dependent oxidoreductase n=1 Tax=Streptomyces sp. HK10 TaxID=3373255 RepID=UPI003749B888
MSDDRQTTAAAPGTAAPGRNGRARYGRLVRPVLGATAGLLSGALALAVAELAAAAVTGPEAGPVTAVGGAVVDRTPAWLKDFAVRTFGDDDKLVLRLGILVLLALFAIALGLLALRRRRAAAAGALLLGAAGAAAAAARPDIGGAGALPSVAGAAAGAGVLYLLAGRPAPTGDARTAGGGAPGAGPEPGTDGGGTSFDRRGFVLAATGTAAATATAGLLARVLTASGTARAAASRESVALPAPASKAPPVPPGADLRLPGMKPFITPNDAFYRVDTALTVPRLDAGAWRLRLHGLGVARPLTLDFRELLERPLVERDITLTCVSNQVGGPYVGTARWLGVPLAELLREAGIRPPSRGGPADQLVSRSVDGMTLGTPVETVMDGRDALLAVGMNGEPLPFDHGFPLRMVVPGLYGYVSACKWLTELELTTFDAYDAYWVRRDWAAEAPVKTQSRIDTPKPLASLGAGTVAVGGVAWAQHTGIDRVEVRVDDGPWRTARLAAEDSADTWRQWTWRWRATPGSHRLEVRATDRGGRVQTAERAGTLPDGATGRHSVVVNVT